MAKALAQGKVNDLDKAIHHIHERLHLLIDIGPKHKRVTASFLTETAIELREALHIIDALALSPFIGFDLPNKGRAIKEPKRLDGEVPMPPNLTIEDEMRKAMNEGTEA